MKKIGNYFFPDSDIHFQRWVLDGEYQKKQRDELFLKMNSIKPIKRICDIGGHVGTWSVPMAQYKDTEMIYAFEPNERVRECFIENTLPFKDKVKVFNVALGNEAGFAWLDIEEENTGNTRIWIDDETPLKTVEVKTLDSFKLKDIDYMKIDVEGFELPVLQGAVETIKDSKPFIHVEMKTKRMLDKREDFEKFFRTIDYKMILRTGSEELYYI
tara:strand:- start:99 stop:740 length:642 start_codon:yes stop_codon:yes gene_type:complete